MKVFERPSGKPLRSTTGAGVDWGGENREGEVSLKKGTESKTVEGSCCVKKGKQALRRSQEQYSISEKAEKKGWK